MKAAHCIDRGSDLIPIQLHVLELLLVRLRGLCRVLCGLCLLSVGWGLLSGSELRIQKGRRRCLAEGLGLWSCLLGC